MPGPQPPALMLPPLLTLPPSYLRFLTPHLPNVLLLVGIRALSQLTPILIYDNTSFITHQPLLFTPTLAFSTRYSAFLITLNARLHFFLYTRITTRQIPPFLKKTPKQKNSFFFSSHTTSTHKKKLHTPVDPPICPSHVPSPHHIQQQNSTPHNNLFFCSLPSSCNSTNLLVIQGRFAPQIQTAHLSST